MKLIDVSNVQGSIDWKAVAASGVHAAFIKASEGATFTDGDFEWNRSQARSRGIHVGAYHFAHPDHNSAAVEAAKFVSVVKSLGRNDLRPVLDFETPARRSPAEMVAWARTFNKAVKKAFGVWPIFYSYPAMISELRATTPIGGALWLASYGVNDGADHGFVVPRPWRKAAVHQFTSRGRVPGVRGFVDVSSAESLRPLLAHPVKRAVLGHNGSPSKAL